METSAAQSKSLVVIGGGITGLSTAFYAKKMAQEQGMPLDITVVEKSGKFGGKINTLEREGFVFEKGPDSFLARKLAIIDLIRDLGLEDELTHTNPEAKKTYILLGGKLHPMPPGLVLGIPTAMGPFMKTGLLSFAGKMRAALDLVLPRRTDPSDESLGHFLERRLGRDVLEHIAEPLLAGIYAGNTFDLSVKATFPQFRSLEQKHRSLILGMMQSKKSGSEESKTLPEVARNSVFLSFKKGLQTLVAGLLKELQDIRLIGECGVSSVRREGNGYRVLYANGESQLADSVVIALPSYAIAEVLAHVPGIEMLRDMENVSVVNVVLAYNEKDLNTSFDGSGFVIPRKEGRFITACTWTSVKWLHTAPKGKVLLRCYVGRSGDDRWLHLSEEELVRAVRKDVAKIMGITAEPILHEITPLHKSMPQYPVGHLERVKRWRAQLAEAMPGVFTTGAAFHGVGLPDCVRQGKEAAADVLAELKRNTQNG
ncbi:protoporphyrinogen oxidase [Paenibacillus thalictri]|uniref:Coproporphyrinogen III oxidase n=1 Tax=Paenibacillus thalictri TaxID=2527873 RepID=A0A4Q9E0A0_9BACL|nr:protoporphyrinogen oxidase [Paenibacillus thalictri]TBL81648.1 protoporphyrinogen oxidase [Paenibacillus thalictri]